jgi:hypothetical protein
MSGSGRNSDQQAKTNQEWHPDFEYFKFEGIRPSFPTRAF